MRCMFVAGCSSSRVVGCLAGKCVWLAPKVLWTGAKLYRMVPHLFSPSNLSLPLSLSFPSSLPFLPSLPPLASCLPFFSSVIPTAAISMFQHVLTQQQYREVQNSAVRDVYQFSPTTTHQKR